MKPNLFKIMITLIVSPLPLLAGTSAKLSDLKKLIPATYYCSNMALIDAAPVIGLTPKGSADYVVISKARRQLYLLKQGQVVKSYNVAFGFGAKLGPKIKRGDGKTPEGLYRIESKNAGSKYHLSLKISYPSVADIAFAKKNKLDPGSDIMIHGFPGSPVDGLDPIVVRNSHPKQDWTAGCIAVTDHEIEEIFSLISNLVPVEICPLR